MRETSHTDTDYLKIAFLGRFNPLKGLHILIQAIRNLPSLKIKLTIHGIVDNEKYFNEILRLIGGDLRIELAKPVDSSNIGYLITKYDLLAVPSQWAETGPLVILESHACGVPVIGSNLGGIAELVTHEVDGFLVFEPTSPHSWENALKYLATNSGTVQKLKQGVKPERVRTTQQQASELIQVYRELLNLA